MLILLIMRYVRFNNSQLHDRLPSFGISYNLMNYYENYYKHSLFVIKIPKLITSIQFKIFKTELKISGKTLLSGKIVKELYKAME